MCASQPGARLYLKACNNKDARAFVFFWESALKIKSSLSLAVWCIGWPVLTVLSGCSSTPTQQITTAEVVAPAPLDTAATATPDNAVMASAGVVGEAGSDAVGLPLELVNKRIFNFAFDSDVLRAEDRPVLIAHAKFLIGQSAVSVRLEGHTDQKGTREYNIGLGERRAQAVRQFLGLQGVQPMQMNTVSFGEESPLVPGEDEVAAGNNRRVELVYGKR